MLFLRPTHIPFINLFGLHYEYHKKNHPQQLLLLFVFVMSNENTAIKRRNLESKWFAFGNEWVVVPVIYPHANQIILRKHLSFIIVHKEEHENMHFFQPHKLLNMVCNERFKINNLLNQMWNKRKELWFHEIFHEGNYNKRVCCFGLFGQIAEISIYIFTATTLVFNCNLFVLKYILFIIVHKEHENMHEKFVEIPIYIFMSVTNK